MNIIVSVIVSLLFSCATFLLLLRVIDWRIKKSQGKHLDRNGPILPIHVNTSSHLTLAFEGCKHAFEKERSAIWIVMLCQEIGTWGPFTVEQMKRFYQRACPGRGRFDDNGLFNPEYGFMMIDGDNMYPTMDFVARCYVGSRKAQKGAISDNT